MRLPILVAARPKASTGCSRIPLGDGKWRIVADRLRDTVLLVYVNDVLLPTPLIVGSDGHFVHGPCEIAVGFAKRGTEDYVHVFAENVS